MDDEAERRIADNEVRFREMNERRRHEGGEFRGDARDSLRVMCECALTSCAVEFELPLDAYLEVRSDARRFVIRAGHQLPGVEQVVDDLGEDRLVIVKVGEGAAVAEGGS